jgi:hypothetical protein
MKYRSGRIAATAALVSMTAPAQAQICEINFGGRLGIGKDGSLQVDFVSAGIVTICSMTATERGVSKEACAAWFSALLSFRLAKVRARFYFSAADPGNANVTTCAQLGDWSVRTPYFLEAY